jgi:hypothetical protein
MEQYIQQLLQEQGVPSDLDPEVRTELVGQVTMRVSNFVNQRLLDAMSDESVDEFNKLLDDDSFDQARAEAFVNEHVPNKDSVVANALVEFRQLYLGDKA